MNDPIETAVAKIADQLGHANARADVAEAELAKVRKQRDQWIRVAEQLAGLSSDLLSKMPNVPAVATARGMLDRIRSMMDTFRRDQP